jgi:hypothetical protein
MIEASAQERLTAAERSRAEAEQTIIEAKADATEAEKALAAKATAYSRGWHPLSEICWIARQNMRHRIKSAAGMVFYVVEGSL